MNNDKKLLFMQLILQLQPTECSATDSITATTQQTLTSQGKHIMNQSQLYF